MNTIYPPNHFGYNGGGGGGGGGFPPGPRGPGDPQHAMMGPGKMAMGQPIHGMNMMGRYGPMGGGMGMGMGMGGGPAGLPQQQCSVQDTQSGRATATSSGDETEAKLCAGCGVKIVERTMLHSMERYWHETCLKCTCCGVNLADSSSCFMKSGMILCRPDYVRLFGHCGVCAACGQNIPASEFVMRTAGGLVYHIRCFSCSKCNTALSRGDRYLLVNGAPVCEQDANKLFPAPAPVKKGKVGRPRRPRD